MSRVCWAMMLEMGNPGESNGPELFAESYKLIAEDLSRVREQRSRAIGSYITINSVIIAACALLIRETGFEIGGWLALLIVLLLAAGATVSLQWIATIREYEILVRVRVGALEQIEGREEMEAIPKVFTDTATELNQSTRNQVAKFFYDRPGLLPALFLVLYAFAGGSVVLLAIGS